MNSPPEPVSPSPSTPSSGSPPPDDMVIEQLASPTSLGALGGSQHSGLPSPGQTKRRLPSGPAAHSRDLKTRKRGDGGDGKRGFVQGAPGEGGREREGREVRPKDELVDSDLMEKLKQEFGDPFDESIPKDTTQ